MTHSHSYPPLLLPGSPLAALANQNPSCCVVSTVLSCFPPCPRVPAFPRRSLPFSSLLKGQSTVTHAHPHILITRPLAGLRRSSCSSFPLYPSGGLQIRPRPHFFLHIHTTYSQQCASLRSPLLLPPPSWLVPCPPWSSLLWTRRTCWS